MFEIFRAHYPREWADGASRAGGGERWAATAMARRLIGLLREDGALPLRDDDALAAEESSDPSWPPYMCEIPITYPHDYDTLLDAHGAGVRDTPAYALLDWTLTEPEPDEPLDEEEMVSALARHAPALAARARAVLDSVRDMWGRYREEDGFSPAHALGFDAGGLCSRRDDGLAELPALIQHRYDYVCAFNGDVDTDDNPFTHWSPEMWAESGLLTWSLANVQELEEKWGIVCDTQERTRLVWATLAGTDGLARLIGLLEELFCDITDVDAAL